MAGVRAIRIRVYGRMSKTDRPVRRPEPVAKAPATVERYGQWRLEVEPSKGNGPTHLDVLLKHDKGASLDGELAAFAPYFNGDLRASGLAIEIVQSLMQVLKEEARG